MVYNNFPWPQAETAKQRQAIEEAAQAVLNVRAKYPGSSLADLYDPLTMPSDLVKAHSRLDAAVDAAYSKKKFSCDSDRVAFLFELYQQILSPLESNARIVRRTKTSISQRN
ncbi:MAG: type IIL restriction-modification enzyme MmeI [Methylocella sp.]